MTDTPGNTLTGTAAINGTVSTGGSLSSALITCVPTCTLVSSNEAAPLRTNSPARPSTMLPPHRSPWTRLAAGSCSSSAGSVDRQARSSRPATSGGNTSR